jgi:hypothetical protein
MHRKVVKAMCIFKYKLIRFFMISFVLFMVTSYSFAQFLPPTGAMDTLNEAPVRGANPAQMDRFGSAGGKGGGRQGGRGDPYNEFGQAGIPNVQGDPNAPPPPTPSPTPKMFRVLSGSRVYCAVSGVLLEDIVFKEITEADMSNFYDDGTHGDEKAADGTYTNITERSDVMSPDSHAILQRLMTMFKNIEESEPMDFYRLNVVTSDPLSSLPKQTCEEKERDIKLSEWNDIYLQKFRVDENDPTSKFYPLYIPPPPSQPGLFLPAGFQPIVAATQTPEGTGGGGYGDPFGDMGVAGSGRGGHQGNYIDTERLSRFK